MEGSRNEKIVIVLSAYVIGFTTAFIAFGINNSYTPSVPEEDFSRSYVQPLSVKVAPQVISSIEENDEGFFAVIGGYKRMLSAKRSTLGANVIASNATSGFYTAVIANTLSKIVLVRMRRLVLPTGRVRTRWRPVIVRLGAP